MTLYEEGLFQLDDPAERSSSRELAGLKVFAGGTADSYQVARAARADDRPRPAHAHLRPGRRATTTSPVGELYRRAGFTGADSDGTLRDMVDSSARIPLQCDPGARVDLRHLHRPGRLPLRGDQRPAASTSFLDERILEPLGMVDTGFSVPAAKLDRFAANYAPSTDAPLYAHRRPAHERLHAAADLLLGRRRPRLDGGRLPALLPDAGQRRRARRRAHPRPAHAQPHGDEPPARRQGPGEMAQNAAETQREGQGFGLGFAVLLDPAVAQVIGTPGEYYWGGAASTAFFINPAEDLIMIFLTQLRPSSTYPIRRELRAAIYSAITS